MHKTHRIILAADGLTLDQTVALVKKVGKLVYGVKIHNLFDEFGESAVHAIKDAGTDIVWVDAKLHDIPETVKARAAVIEASGANMLTVHASGGVKMMMAAREGNDLDVMGVTILTSLSAEDAQLIYGLPAQLAVMQLARLAKLAKLQGIVCSPKEVGALSRMPELAGMKFVIPGIRSAGVKANDQERIATPEEAIINGATHLVIGRQITTAPDPEEAIGKIFQEIESGERKLWERTHAK